MQSPDASPKCLPIGLVICLLLAMPVFLMMFVDVNATPLPQHIAAAHTKTSPRPTAPAKLPASPPVCHP